MVDGEVGRWLPCLWDAQQNQLCRLLCLSRVRSKTKCDSSAAIALHCTAWHACAVWAHMLVAESRVNMRVWACRKHQASCGCGRHLTGKTRFLDVRGGKRGMLRCAGVPAWLALWLQFVVCGAHLLQCVHWQDVWCNRIWCWARASARNFESQKVNTSMTSRVQESSLHPYSVVGCDVRPTLRLRRLPGWHQITPQT